MVAVALKSWHAVKQHLTSHLIRKELWRQSPQYKPDPALMVWDADAGGFVNLFNNGAANAGDLLFHKLSLYG